MALSLLSLIASLCLPTLAAARGLPRIYGSAEQLHFVAGTTLHGAEGPLAPCHRSTKYHLFGLGLWRQATGLSLPGGRA